MPPTPLSAQQTGALWAYLNSMPEPAHRAPGVPAPTAFRVTEAAQHPARVPARASVAPPSIPAQPAPQPLRSQPTASVSLASREAAGQAIFTQHACIACHGAQAQGTKIAPALAGISLQLPEKTFAFLINHPLPQMTAKGMPPAGLSVQQTHELWNYLNSLPVPKNASPLPITALPSQAATSSPAPVATPQPSAAAAKQPATPQAAQQPATSQLSAAAAAGEQIFTSHGCIACHGVNGVGTPLAVSLIGVTHKYAHQQLIDLSRHPNARMKAGGMPTFTFTDPQINNLVAYLAQLHKPSSATAARAGEAAPVHHAPPHKLTAEEQEGREVYLRARCSTCHGDGGMEGTAAAPSLTATASELPPDMIRHLLQHPSDAMQSHGMPPVSLNQADLKALISYIRALRYNR